MDSFARLIAFLALLLGLGQAQAINTVAAQTTPIYTCFNPSNSLDQSEATSAASACQGIVGHLSGTKDRGWYREVAVATLSGCGQGSCTYQVTTTYPTNLGGPDASGPTTSSGSMAFSGPDLRTACPPNSTSTGKGGDSGCACGTLYIPSSDGKACQQYTCPPSGSYSAVTQPDQKVPNAGDTLCTGGCSYKPSSWKVGEDGSIWATWPFKSSGGFCAGDPKPDVPGASTGEKNNNNPAPVACGTNQCPGTVNGATICVPCKKQQTEGPSSSSSAPAGAASAPPGTQTGNSSSTSTSCSGTTCTTTTTTRDPSGTVIGVEEKTQEQPSFCRENPESALCKQSSFGGQCAATTCEGDAVQCAIAADQYRRNCQWFDDPATPALKEAGDSAMNGQAHPDGHPYNSAESQSMDFGSRIDQTDRLGAGCPTDESVSFWGGQSLTLPFSRLCGPLSWLGQLLIGITWLACAFIVFKS